MLSARDLTLRRGPEPLFEHANFTIFRGERVGLTGANGAGKSSLFAAISGDLSPDKGSIERPAKMTLAMVEQEISALERPAIEFVLDGDLELRRISGDIAAAEADESRAMELAELHSELLGIDGYRARARAAAIMHGLGFASLEQEKPIGEFSGGWRVRAAMARALNSRADLLLLDEPTNHLDLDAIVWLEEWLGSFPGTLLMISHDRDFLDAVIGRVLHIEQGEVHAYSGNYSQFELKRAEELALQKTMLARQQRQVAHITSFINRFRASATKARQAQSRIKMLARMERIVPAHADSPFEFEFLRPLKAPRPLLAIEDGACGYGARRIVGDINISLGPQDRVALLGANGAGKSTLTKLLAGESALLHGTRIAAPDLVVGYFAQHQLEQLNVAESAFWHMRHRAGSEFARSDEQTLRDHLGRFGFAGDAAFASIGRFSGGEKARLTLALLVARRPNLLLLDEPTNHLDIEMRHALTVALQTYEGGLVLVSHDRHLIKMTADSLWVVADERVTRFDGDLDDYQASLKNRPEGAAARPGRDQGTQGGKRTENRARKRRSAVPGVAGTGEPALGSPASKRIADIEHRLSEVQGQLARIDARLAQAAASTAPRRDELDGCGRERSTLAARLDQLEQQWLEASAALERES